MLKRFFASTAYVKLYVNQLWLRQIENGKRVDMGAAVLFTSRPERGDGASLLVGPAIAWPGWQGMSVCITRR